MVERRIGSFYARADDGTMFEVIEWQTEVQFRPLDRGTKLLSGGIAYRLADGRHVNPIENDPMAFEIVDTEQIVRKIG